MHVLQLAMCGFTALDTAIFALSYFSPAHLALYFPQYAASEQLGRMIGIFFLLCAIVRGHSAMHITEKGAYRVAAWSWIVEIILHVAEMHHGNINKKDCMPVYALCGGMFLWQTLSYSSILYPEKRKDAKAKN